MKNLFVFSVLALFVLQGCDNDDLCLIGSGTVNEYQLTVDDFANVSLYGPINLRIKQAPNFSVVVDAEPEIYSSLTYVVKNGTLEIGFKDNITCFETNYGVWVNVSVPDIESIYSSGVSDIVSDGNLDLDQLLIEISGTSNVELSGQVTELFYESSGVLNVKNYNLQTNDTEIDVSGTGDFEITCTDNLDIDVSGIATVSYKGTPSINQNVSGTLNLNNAN